MGFLHFFAFICRLFGRFFVPLKIELSGGARFTPFDARFCSFCIDFYLFNSYCYV